MHKQVSGWTVNFCPNFPESPFLEFQTRKPPPPPFQKSSDLRWPKFTPKYPPPPFRKSSDLRWPKFTPEYPHTPPISEKFRFEMTKVYLEYPPHFRKLQIWDDQSLLWNTPHPPHFGKIQIWDDQSLLWNTPPPPPFWKTSDLRWPKFTPEYPLPISENAGDRMWRLICNPQGYHSFCHYFNLGLLSIFFNNCFGQSMVKGNMQAMKNPFKAQDKQLHEIQCISTSQPSKHTKRNDYLYSHNFGQ